MISYFKREKKKLPLGLFDCVSDHTWTSCWTYPTCMGCMRGFPSPVSLSLTRIRTLRSRQGEAAAGESPVTVREASNSCATVSGVKSGQSIGNALQWKLDLKDTDLAENLDLKTPFRKFGQPFFYF